MPLKLFSWANKSASTSARLAIVVCSLQGCLHSEGDEDFLEQDPPAKHLSWQDITDPHDLSRQEWVDRLGAGRLKRIRNIKQQADCYREHKALTPAQTKVAQAYQDLFSHLELKPGSLDQTSPEDLKLASLLAEPSPLLASSKDRDACPKDQEVKRFYQWFKRPSAARIGIFLPTSDPSKGWKSTQILHGIKKACHALIQNNTDIACKQSFSFYDLNDSIPALEKQFANAIFRDRVSMILVGFSRQTTQTLANLADKLKVPVVMLNKGGTEYLGSNYLFQVFPDESMMAEALALAAKRRGILKVAILRPQHGQAKRQADALSTALARHGSSATEEWVYTSGDFASMDEAVKRLLHILPEERPEEYELAIEQARSLAEGRGQGFDPRLIVLEPDVRVQAVFIPDDFRIVRHVTKLLRYRGIQRLPLMGNHEWRSKTLLTPYDRFLENAFFADFVGPYVYAGKLLNLDLPDPSLFVTPQMATNVDFQLIGYRAAELALSALQDLQNDVQSAAKLKAQSKSKSKFKPKPTSKAKTKTPTFIHRIYLRNALARLKQTPTNSVFRSDKAFDKDQQAFWPVYTFTIRAGGLRWDVQNY